MSLTIKMGKSLSGQMIRTTRTVTAPGSFTPYPRVPRPQVSPRTRYPGSVRPTVMRRMGVGDPGIFGDILGGIGKVASFVPGVGGIVGGGIQALAQAVDPDDEPELLPMPRGTAPPLPGPMAAIQRFVPGGETGYGFTQKQLRFFKNRAGRPAKKRGHIWNKSDYFLSDGTFVPAGSKQVKRRRRNPMNPRALDRALGRLNSAKRLQSKLSGYSTSKYTASGRKKACK